MLRAVEDEFARFAVLHEEDALRLPEQGVLGRVAELELGPHLGGEVVRVVLRLDATVDEAVLVEEGAVEAERCRTLAVQLVLADERPVQRAGAGLDELVEGGADRGFVPGADVGELGEGEVIAADGPVRRLEIERRGHAGAFSQARRAGWRKSRLF